MKSNELTVGFAVGALTLGLTAWLTMHLSTPTHVMSFDEAGLRVKVSESVSSPRPEARGEVQLIRGLDIVSTGRRSI